MKKTTTHRNYNQSLPSSLCEQELVSCWFLSIWCPEENLDRSAFSLYQPPPQQVVVREQPPASEHQHTNYELNEAMEEEEEDLWPSIERTYSFDDWSEDENPNPTDSALEGGLMIPRSFTFDEWDSREDTEVHANGLGHSNPSDKVMLSNVPTPKETYLFRPIQHGRLSLDTTTSTSKTLSITTSAGSDCLPSIDTSSPCTTTPAVEECRGIQRCTPLLLDNSLDTTDAVSVESPEPAADYERQQYFPTFMYDLPHEEQEETTDNMAMQPPIPRVIYVPRPQQRRNNNNSQWRRQLVQSWRRMVAPRRDAAWKCPKPLYRRGHHFQQQHQQRFRRSGFQKTRKMGEF
eukprot:Nitzschia sp. Nitz4//scaffold5_size260463//160852//162127//NITZ4_000993-RA/size260463-snap-gene-0.15-mRNA-1//1//CDS//3329555373//7484//frame0